jgi:hypothetical protein
VLATTIAHEHSMLSAFVFLPCVVSRRGACPGVWCLVYLRLVGLVGLVVSTFSSCCWLRRVYFFFQVWTFPKFQVPKSLLIDRSIDVYVLVHSSLVSRAVFVVSSFRGCSCSQNKSYECPQFHAFFSLLRGVHCFIRPICGFFRLAFLAWCLFSSSFVLLLSSFLFPPSSRLVLCVCLSGCCCWCECSSCFFFFSIHPSVRQSQVKPVQSVSPSVRWSVKIREVGCPSKAKAKAESSSVQSSQSQSTFMQNQRSIENVASCPSIIRLGSYNRLSIMKNPSWKLRAKRKVQSAKCKVQLLVISLSYSLSYPCHVPPFFSS